MNINIDFDLDKNTYADFINYAFDTSDAVGFVFKKYKQRLNKKDSSRMPFVMYDDTEGVSMDALDSQKAVEIFEKQYAKFKEKVGTDVLRIKNLAEWPTIGCTVIYKGRPKDDFEIIICRCSDEIRRTALSVGSFSRWIYPYFPEDICFFRNHYCWFLSNTHEKYAVLTITNVNDIINLEKIKVIDNTRDERYFERY